MKNTIIKSMIPSGNFTLVFSHKKQLTNDAYTFYFIKPDNFIYTAGQYMKITIPIENPDERGTNRLFTISSSPLDKYITVTTRIIQSSFKKTLKQLQSGFQIPMYGPLGRFVLNEEDETPCILLAGGIGITPFHSIITYAYQKKLTIPLTLFVSFSTTEEILFYEELTQLSNQNQFIKVIYTITKPDGSKMPWNGVTGRISKELIEKYAPHYIRSKFYVVGPPKMVEAMEHMVQEFGIPKEKILKENFTGY